jgi:4-hydroxy-tetrahydrodipicolinate synthase
MSHPSSGVLAALITPVDERGRADFNCFNDVIEFVLERGVDGVVVGGGTAEYPHLSIEDREKLAGQAVRTVNGRGKVLTSIGTSSIHSTLRLARHAEKSGCDALLLPMPYFFRYEQEDLAAFCEEVCRNVSLPCFLYNLPSFTNPLEVETSIKLLTSVPNLVGIKDSSGSVDSLQQLAHARNGSRFSLFVGDDSFLLPALRNGWDGVVSGIACFVPELIVALYRSYRAGDLATAEEYQSTLDVLIEQIVQLPIPWGVRVGLATRGVPSGPLHLPLSPSRARQVRELERWLSDWMQERQLEHREVWSRL